MTFTLCVLPPQDETSLSWARRLADDMPEVNVVVAHDAAGAKSALQHAEAAYGTLPADLLVHAEELRWLQAPMAGPEAGYFYPELVAHPVVVTNLRGTYTEHVATHAIALLLALARGIPDYAVQQREGGWLGDWDPDSVLDLPHAAVLIVGVGAIGTEVARLLAPFGPRLIGMDARRTDPGPLHELHPPDVLDKLLPRADATVLAVPHTPVTDGLIDARRLALMHGYLVNVGRGPLVRTGDLVEALRDGHLRGAALDVVDPEPLPDEHPLRAMPNVLITPHVAGVGPGTDERRYGVLLDNARRFAKGEPLRNVVDKVAWF